MHIAFEHDQQKRLMLQRFGADTVLASEKDVQMWKNQWMQELKQWHSPYKLLLDCTHLAYEPVSGEVVKALERMLKFFEGLFLRKVVGFGLSDNRGHKDLPFDVVATEEEARAAAGIRERKDAPAATDFRAAIHLHNDFKAHVMELGFTAEVVIDNAEKMQILRSKLLNNLVQWHSPWNLLIDCQHVMFEEAGAHGWPALERFLRGFFLKNVVGYAPSQAKEKYPFPVYRARHKAVAELESEGAFLASEANCQTRKG